MEKMYKIYMHKSPSGNVYIGQTKTSTNRRWQNGNGYKSCYVFNRAIQKYGWDNFEHKILYKGLSQIEANIIEEDLIYYYKSIGKSYNIKDGTTLSIDMCNKISKTSKGKHRSPNTEFKKGHSLNSKTVEQYTLDGHLIKVWNSASEASRQCNICRSMICRACRGIIQTYKNYM